MENQIYEDFKKEMVNLFNKLRGGNITAEQYDELKKLLEHADQNVLIPASYLNRNK